MNACVTVESDVHGTSEVDLVEEMRLRTWARRNYVPMSQRDFTWHPVVRDEMNRIDRESL